jgi:hypothetical protein
MGKVRRVVALLLIATALASACATANAPVPEGSGRPSATPAAADHTFARLEQRFGARLGVYLLDTEPAVR